MKATRPDVSPDGRYDIRSTCKHLGICRTTLDKYTKLFLIVRDEGIQGPYYLGSEILAFWEGNPSPRALRLQSQFGTVYATTANLQRDII